MLASLVAGLAVDELRFSLEPVSEMKRARFPLEGGDSLNLRSAFLELKECFDCEHCRYDETFNRIILKQATFTVSIFYTGKVIVSGLFEDHILLVFLSEIWAVFLKKNVQKSAKNLPINL